MNIEISGHTDSRGSASYNQTLSENRSKSVVDYLVAIGGFPRERFEFKGYGEQQPLTTDQEIAKMKIKEEREETDDNNDLDANGNFAGDSAGEFSAGSP